MAQVQGGLGVGASKDRIIWVFETNKSLADFINSGWEFGGKAQAVAMVQETGACSQERFPWRPACTSANLPRPGSQPS
jgi:hypothetical protein